MAAPDDGRRYSRDGQWVWDGGDWVPVRATPTRPAPHRDPHHHPRHATARPLAGIGRRGRIALAIVVAAMACLIAAAFAVAVLDAATTASPDTSPSAPPALRAATAADLRAAVTAQDEVHASQGRYAEDAAALVAAGLRTTVGVTVRVLSADATSYCMSASGAGVTLYASAADPEPSAQPCR